MEGKESCVYFSGRKCLARSARVFVTERRMNLWGLTHTSSEEGFWDPRLQAFWFVCLLRLLVEIINLEIYNYAFVVLFFLPWPERL